MYKKTYYGICVSPHMPIVNHNLVQGISEFGAKWQGTFEATALVW